MPQSRPAPSTTGHRRPLQEGRQAGDDVEGILGQGEDGSLHEAAQRRRRVGCFQSAPAHQAHQAALLGDGDYRRGRQAQRLAGGHLDPHGGRLFHVLEAAARGAAHHHGPGRGPASQLPSRAGELPLPPGAAGGAEHQQGPGGESPDGGAGVGRPQHALLGDGDQAGRPLQGLFGGGVGAGLGRGRHQGSRDLQRRREAPGHAGGEQGVGPAGHGGDDALDP